jgi:hypothetical protein
MILYGGLGGNCKSIVSTGESIVLTIKSIVSTSRSIVSNFKSIVLTSKSIVSTIKSIVLTTKSIVSTGESIVLTIKSIVLNFKSIVSNFKSIVLNFKSIVLTGESIVTTTYFPVREGLWRLFPLSPAGSGEPPASGLKGEGGTEAHAAAHIHPPPITFPTSAICPARISYFFTGRISVSFPYR